MAGMLIGMAVKAATGSAIAGMVASYAVDALISSQQSGPQTFGPKLQDTKIQTSTEGAPIIKVYGAARTAGNIIWSAGIKETTNVEEVGGGKGGPSPGTHTTYTYSCSFAVALCEGPMAGIARIWANNVLIYNNTNLSTSDEVVVSDSLGMTEYLGSEDQAVSPLIEAVEGSANTPAFRGLAYITFTDLQLEKFGNRIPNLTCEVAVAGSTSPLALSSTFEMTEIQGANQSPYYYDNDSDLMFGLQALSFSNGAGTGGGDTAQLREFTVSASGTFTPGTSYTWDYMSAQYDTDFSTTVGTSDDGGYLLYRWNHPHWEAVYKQTNGYDVVIRPGAYMNNALPWARGGEYLYMVSGAYLFYTQFEKDYTSPSVLGITHMTLPADKATIGDIVVSDDMFADSDYFYLTYNTNANTRKIARYLHGTTTPESTMATYKAGAGGLIEGVTIKNGSIYYTVSNGSFVVKHATFGASHEFIPADGAVHSSILPSYKVYAVGDSDQVFAIWDAHYSHPNDLPGKMYLYSSSLQIGSDTLPAIITDLCDRVGVTDIDVSTLNTNVKGYVRTNPMTARVALNPLLEAYSLIATETDYNLVFNYKDGQFDKVVYDSELAATESKKSPDRLRITRIQDTELPRRVEVKYSDFDGDYQDGNQFAQRIKT